MSVISGIHSFVKFDSKTSRAWDGQRLIKITYKTVRKGDKAGTKKDSMCVSVPPVADLDDVTLSAFKPYIKALREDTQDKIARDLYEAGRTEITDSDLCDTAILAWLEEEAKGNRLTKEAVIAWFDATMADTLTVAFGDKLGVSDVPNAEQVKQIEGAIEVYRKMFAGLAGGKTSYAPNVAVKLLKAFEIVGCDDDIAKKFTARLEGMKEEKGADLMGL